MYIPVDNSIASIYAIKNMFGEYFKNSHVWTKNFEKAKLYRKIGPAKSAATSYALKHEAEQVPIIVEFRLTYYNEINQTERVNKLRQKRIRELAAKLEKDKKKTLEKAVSELENAKHRYEKAVSMLDFNRIEGI